MTGTHQPPPAGDGLEVLVFELASWRIAVAASAVQEVVRAVAATPLPGAPPIVEGVVDARGTVMPVLDLRRRLGLPLQAVRPDDHLVLARAGVRAVALRVDRVLALVRIDGARIEDVERLAPGTAHVAGVARTGDGLLLIHDLERFLSTAEAEALDRALAPPPPPPSR